MKSLNIILLSLMMLVSISTISQSLLIINKDTNIVFNKAESVKLVSKLIDCDKCNELQANYIKTIETLNTVIVLKDSVINIEKNISDSFAKENDVLYRENVKLETKDKLQSKVIIGSGVLNIILIVILVII